MSCFMIEQYFHFLKYFFGGCDTPEAFFNKCMREAAASFC